MAPRKKNASIKSTGATSSKAAPLPDWVKNKNAAKPPPKYTTQQQQQPSTATKAKDSFTLSASSNDTTAVAPSRPLPLFPPGTKTPINLLNERIQKHHAPKGWLKPNIDARRASKGYVQRAKGTSTDNDDDEEDDQDDKTDDTSVDNGNEELWTFSVTLTKTNKSDQSNPFTVRMDARDVSGYEGSVIVLDSKEKAKHWGATYALFRLCSNLSLDQILPTGPREYWKILATHKSRAPDHLAWLWQADPFDAAQKMQTERQANQAAREKRRREVEENGPRLPRQWLEAREVRMAKELRDMVEETVREALKVYPMDNEAASLSVDEQQHASGASTPRTSANVGQENPELLGRLTTLGFRLGHARSALRWLSMARRGQSSTATAAAAASSSSLRAINKLNDEDACLEYLAIFCPEDDLPARFAPSRKADSFVTGSASAAAGDALADRWIEERLTKLAGYPRSAVQSTLAMFNGIPAEWKEAACVDVLLRKLCSLPFQSLLESIKVDDQKSSQDSLQARSDERMALEAVLGPERVLEIASSERPLVDIRFASTADLFDLVIATKPEEDIRLRICTGATSSYPTQDPQSMPTFYIASSTLPAYLRLAMTQRLGRCLAGLEKGFEDWSEMLIAGQGGVILAMVEELETCWREMTQNPPDLADVMAGVTRPSTSSGTANEKRAASESVSTNGREKRQTKKKFKALPLEQDQRADETLKAEHASLLQSANFAPINVARMKLPAANSASEIISLLERHRLLIIAGETGCGKTTQCPQFILDHMVERGDGSICNIVVTQPRRLSAMGVAARVAYERCEALDGKGKVGYAIRGESKSGRQTRLLFTTTGVLLRRLSTNDPDLRGVSHVFVDEVHERGVESDLLLLELRQVLQRNPTLRVVLMSATIERETFTNYFPDTPTINIPGRTFPVVDHYLEDIRVMLGKGQDSDAHEEVDHDNKKSARHSIRESIDYDLLAQTVDMICKRAERANDSDGAILVFLPGVGEIRRAVESIQRIVGSKTDVLPLHANLSPDEQRSVFRKARVGKRKVICSTNVAETSITIDDVVYVVDAGLVKEPRYDPQSGLTKLVETRCSQANARQRRGRAGRVRAGECFRLYTRSVEQYRMDPQQVPEMKRMSLENLVLNVKALKGDATSVEAYLGSAISPPSMEAIGNAVQLLTQMNVLIEGQRLSALGRHLSLLPLDVRLAKMMVLGCIFRCLEPMLTAAAILSSKPLFNAPFDKREEASKARTRFAHGNSDILTDVNAFNAWQEKRKRGDGNAAMRTWCEDNFVSASSLRDIVSVRNDLTGNLIEMGFIPSQYRRRALHGNIDHNDGVSALDGNASDVNLQRALLLAALYPSVVRVVHPQAKYDKAIGGTVEREAEARQIRFVDAQRRRVFLHPSSVLFSANRFQSDFLASFRRGASQSQQKEKQRGADGGGDKVYLRDATEVPMYALLLFGGQLRIHRRQGGISIGGGDHTSEGEEEGWIKVRANGRIAALINQLRYLLDAALDSSFDDPTSDVFAGGIEARVRDCLQAILQRDGL